MGKSIYIFMYEIENTQAFDFVDIEDTLNDTIDRFVKNKPNISKLIVVDIKHTYKIALNIE